MVKNEIWLMEQSALRECVDRYNTAILDTEQIRMFDEAFEVRANSSTSLLLGSPSEENENRTAIINVHGTLTPNFTFMTWLMGGTACSDILLQIDEAEKDDSIDTVIFDFDTGGGAVSGIESVEVAINSMTKKKIGYVRGVMASAGYWLGSAMDKIYGLETSMVGSIGVIITLVDYSKYDEKMGIREYDIVSKNAPNKRPDVTTDEGYAQYQKMVDDTEKIFIEHIATNRGVTSDTVRSDYGQGGLMLFAEAIEVGMVDGIKTFEMVGAEISQVRENDMGIEMKDLSIEQLKLERPDLVEAITGESMKIGASDERARLSALDELKGSEVADKIIAVAREDGREAKDISMDILKAERAELKKVATNALADVTADAKKMEVETIVPVEGAEVEAEADAKLDAELKEFYKGDK